MIKSAAKSVTVGAYEQLLDRDSAKRKRRELVIKRVKEDLEGEAESTHIWLKWSLLNINDFDTLQKALRTKRCRKEWRDFLSRLKMALFGGLSLIIPMLIMTLHPTILTALLTTTLFVLAVALILASVMTDAESKDVVGATAAYAAVLVVFIGTSNASGGMSDGLLTGIVIGVTLGVMFIGGIGGFFIFKKYDTMTPIEIIDYLTYGWASSWSLWRKRKTASSGASNGQRDNLGHDAGSYRRGENANLDAETGTLGLARASPDHPSRGSVNHGRSS